MSDLFLPEIPVFDEGHCYRLGYDCGKNGSDTTNCHFAAFATPAKTRAWEQGKADAEAGRPNAYDKGSYPNVPD